MSDIDQNNHLNNAGYLRIVMDAFSKLAKNASKKDRLKYIKAIYKKEIICGDCFHVCIHQSLDHGGYYCAQFLSFNDDELFQAKFNFL